MASLIYKTEKVTQVTASNTPEMNYQNNSLAFQLLYNDLHYDPYKYVNGGAFFRFKAEQGGKVFDSIDLGGIQFQRYDLNSSVFWSLFSLQDVLALRVMSGVYLPEDPTLPVLEGEQYSIGGSVTLRGIADQTTLVRRGPRMLLGNLEYRHAFSELFQAVLFADCGDAFTRDELKAENFRVGKGAGMRLTISGFTIRLDYGVVEDLDGVLYFTVGQMF
jgi:outer membrane protein assembly factor BamA